MTIFQLAEMFAGMERREYTKQGTFIYRDAAFHPSGQFETVLTIVSGKLESVQPVLPGFKVIRNITIGGGAETFTMHARTFFERYDPLPGGALHVDGHLWWQAASKGRVTAAQYAGEPFEFVSYQERQYARTICEPGDFLVADTARPDEVYRVERAAFHQMYKPSENE